jgi:thiamine biosynthesis lipoprotein
MLIDGREERMLVQQTRGIMATPVGVYVAVAPEDEARAYVAIGDCLAWLEEVDRRLTRFVHESELSQLNAAAGAWRPVSELLFTVVEQSVAAAEASGGLFDPTLLAVLEALGYDRDFKEIAYREVPAVSGGRRQADGPGGWRGIELDGARRQIRLPPGARLDLGGIAKGWAADVALDRFFASLPDVLIDLGGDLRARGGLREGEPWAIAIGDPRDLPDASDSEEARHTPVLTLGRGGLATSGATWRWWYQGGERQHHLIDPRRGRPARVWIDATDTDAPARTTIAVATALAPTAAHAEVAAKVALLRGYPQALDLVDAAWKAARGDDERETEAGYGDAAVALLLRLGTGDVVCSAHLQDYLATLGGDGHLWLD